MSKAKQSPAINRVVSGDYSSSYNTFVFNLIAKNTTCLDIGCWTGNLGEALIKNKNCIVDGIDFREDVLQKAIARGYTNTYKLNLNNDNFDLSQITQKYDYIIFADVLEHLINPQQILVLFKKFLKKNGKIIISLPNVAFALNRLNLLLGKWNYTEFGTLDKTHLKFFTLKTGEHLVKSAGYRVDAILPYNQFGILTKLHPLDKIFPTLLCYQFVIVGQND